VQDSTVFTRLLRCAVFFFGGDHDARR
jgi:hypothetical protein